MRRIEKHDEPECLALLRATPGADTWSAVPGDCKQSMREAAFAEQHGLCAYCQSRLTDTSAAKSGGEGMAPDGRGMKLEHWAARNAEPGRILDWSSLLGVCPGVVIGGPTDEVGQVHCDTFRGRLPTMKQTLHHNPAAFPPNVGTLFRYTSAGEMRSDDTDAERDVERLNLNLPRLKRNRQGIIEKLRQELRRDHRTANLKELYRKATRVDSEGRLPAYSQVMVYYLAKKLRQRGEAIP